MNAEQLKIIDKKSGNEKALEEIESVKSQIIVVMDKSNTVSTAVEKGSQKDLEMPAVEKVTSSLEDVQKVLELFHAVTMHQAMGKKIPSVLDFFVKVLLGTTRPPQEVSFDENLSESMTAAKKYLSMDPHVVACDMSYAQIYDCVQELITPTPKVEEPEFNFFADTSNSSTSSKSCAPGPKKVNHGVKKNKSRKERNM